MVKVIVSLLALSAASGCKNKSDSSTNSEGEAHSHNGKSHTHASQKGPFKVTVADHGYEPGELMIPANQPSEIIFTRTSKSACGEKVVFPDLKLEKELPLNTPVSVNVTVTKDKPIRFACGMDMMRGSIVAIQ